ncbi:MAG: 3-oxoacyl-[acyl-carrier-protein] reductase [Polyangiaceae bacterium]|nr:3-oxoacyl-[acyl-carrier-protein] reductase [Polyangiaceae bacterium]
MFDLNGKVAIVTGGSRGIGRATALALAERGAHVVVGFATSEAAAREVVTEIEGSGGRAEAVRLELSDPAATTAALTEVARRHGRVDILVANAGISIDALLLRLKDEDLDRVLAVNLRGAIACARAVLKPMMRARGGRIIFVSSVVGEAGNAGQTAYAASKAGLLGAAKSVAREYASRGITVNAVTPGFIETDMTASLPGEIREASLQGIPLGRFGAPAEIAAAIVFLASDEAGYVTGHVLRVNGGMYM